MTPRLRPCGNPECRICRWNDEQHHDSGHPVEAPADTWMNLALGAAALVIAFIFFFVMLPALLA